MIQKTTTDETLVAEALRNSGEVFQLMPFEDRLGLMQHLIKEIRVSRIEPENFVSELPPNTFVTQLRTQWYKLEFDFFYKVLIPKDFRNSKILYQRFVF